MLPIFICEDNVIYRNTLERYIANYILMEELSMEITISTADPHVILDYLARNPKTKGIYFLDVDLGCDINGVDLAIKIRKIDPLGSIVFVTTQTGLAPSLFKHRVEALGYITKDNLPEVVQQEVVECLQTVASRIVQTPSYDDVLFKVKVGSQVKWFPIADILFFESAKEQKKVTLYIRNGAISFFGKLKEIEDFHPNFIMIHKSVVANKANILALGAGNDMNAYFANGDSRPVSTRLINVLKKEFEL